MEDLHNDLMEFARRVLKGKDVTPQETAILPDILNIMIKTEEDRKK